MIEIVFRRLFHWGPLIALGIIFTVSVCTVSCLGQWHNNRDVFLDLAEKFRKSTTSGYTVEDQLPRRDVPPTKWSRMSPYVLITFLLCSSSTLYNYINAMFRGPGIVPTGWRPSAGEDRACLQYCQCCCSYKPPRAHHCRQCGVCVLKMDHHCPWINNCVGHRNQAHFTMFLASAVVGCSVATAVMAPSVYWAMYRRWYLQFGDGEAPIIMLSLWGLLETMFVLGLAIGVVVAVGLLLYFQIRAILRNRTGIEDWILEKANYRRLEANQPPFVYPYDLGRWQNWREVFCSVTCTAKGDGVEWPVRPGTHQYTLTVEQLVQKACKRARALRCVVRRAFSGWWLPVTHGWGVLCRPPYTDEHRVALTEGQVVTVTRWKRYWLYGDCQAVAVLPSSSDCQKPVSAESSPPPRRRGWFPRHCVVPLLEDINSDQLPSVGNRAKDFLNHRDISDATLDQRDDGVSVRRRRLPHDPLPEVPRIPSIATRSKEHRRLPFQEEEEEEGSISSCDDAVSHPKAVAGDDGR